MKLGKYELNKIYNEDCYEAIKSIPDKSIDLIVTDPPYVYEKNSFKGFFETRKVGYELQDLNICEGINEKILYEFIRVSKKLNIYIWIFLLIVINVNSTYYVGKNQILLLFLQIII